MKAEVALLFWGHGVTLAYQPAHQIQIGLASALVLLHLFCSLRTTFMMSTRRGEKLTDHNDTRCRARDLYPAQAQQVARCSKLKLL